MTLRFRDGVGLDANGGWVPEMVHDANGDFVHYSDYEKLVAALRHIVRFSGNFYGINSPREVAEAALLSAGEGL